MPSSAIDSAVFGAPTMRRAAAETAHEPRERPRALASVAAVANVSRAALAPMIMANCSGARTLTDFCRNASETTKFPTAFVCVGSAATQSCPQHPTILEWDRAAGRAMASKYGATTGNGIDASALGIERVVLSDHPGIDSLLLNDNQLTELALSTKMDTLNAANNRFTSFDDIVLPFGVGELNVSHNTLQSITLSSAMAKLTMLDARNASLKEVDAAKAMELLTLLAPYNQLTIVDKVVVPSRLRLLDLAYNSIEDWSGFAPPRALRVLNGSHNGATQFVQGNWSELASKLEVVNFSSNSLTSIRGIAWPETLRELDLRDNPLDVIEIFDTDVPTFQQLAVFLVPDHAASITTDVCVQRNATAQRVANGVTVCVVPAPTAPQAPSDALHDSSSSLIVTAIVSFLGVGLLVLLAIGLVLRRRLRHASLRDLKVASPSMPSNRSAIHRSQSVLVMETLAALRAEDALVASLIHAADVKEVRVIDDSGAARTTLVRVGERELVRRQLRGEVSDRAVLALAREIRAAAPLEHAKIVPFRGFSCSSVQDLALYTEYMANGSLASLLKLFGANKYHHAAFPWVATGATTTDAVRLDLAVDVAEALVYLHSFEPPVVHGNVRTKNVLLDAAWHARLTGVGHRVEVASGVEMWWLAPEILRGAIDKNEAAADTAGEDGDDEEDSRGYSPASDVYAFGVFLSELDACGAARVNRGREDQPTTTQLASETRGREIELLFDTNSCPDGVRTLAASCVAANREARPSAMKVYYELCQLRKQLRLAAQNQRHISV